MLCFQDWEPRLNYIYTLIIKGYNFEEYVAHQARALACCQHVPGLKRYNYEEFIVNYKKYFSLTTCDIHIMKQL